MSTTKEKHWFGFFGHLNEIYKWLVCETSIKYVLLVHGLESEVIKW